ncbi:MAG TPA: hypothetical protein VNA24_36515 [Hyalangium sp.]|nr:hypothetical protein [Hyalangium sp.]
MKRVLLLAIVSVVSSFACAEGEAWVPGKAHAPQAQLQGLENSSESTPTETSSFEICTDIPRKPPVPEEMNLDRWDFNNIPLLPTTTATRSLYLVAFASPVDVNRIYVYGIDVVAGRFLFAGSLNRRYVPFLSRRMGIDLGNYQASGAANPKSAGLLEVELPTPPPPPPNIHDWSVENYGIYAWQKAAIMHSATW